MLDENNTHPDGQRCDVLCGFFPFNFFCLFFLFVCVCVCVPGCVCVGGGGGGSVCSFLN